MPSSAKRIPFEVTFMSDATEVASDEDKEAGRSQAGFRLQFSQDSNNC